MDKEKFMIIIIWRIQDGYFGGAERLDVCGKVRFKKFESTDDPDKQLLIVQMETEEKPDIIDGIIKSNFEFVKTKINEWQGHYLLLLHAEPKIPKEDLLKDLGNIPYILFRGRYAGTEFLYQELLELRPRLKKESFENGKIKTAVFEYIWDEITGE